MTQTIELPPAQLPTVTRVFSKRFGIQRIGEAEEFIEPLLWEVDQDHPLIPPDRNGNKVRIVRMFLVEQAVQVYSLMPGGMRGIRDTIPLSEIRMVQEMMPAPVFIEELAASEYGEPDLEDLEDEEEEETNDDEGEDKPIHSEPHLQAVRTESTEEPS